jgi:hypothetical protein
MSSLFARRDVVAASVSCIYGIGSKEDYEAMVVPIRVGQEITREQLLSRLVALQYNRNDITSGRGDMGKNFFRLPPCRKQPRLTPTKKAPRTKEKCAGPTGQAIRQSQRSRIHRPQVFAKPLCQCSKDNPVGNTLARPNQHVLR